ncbi:MAG TPA: protein kinase [Candidatus Binataceae bacterium]|nr:protein kinase [Candidatus Binataceae bacterium]
MKPGEPLPSNHLLDGRYRIHKILGQGGMGRVYLANDTRLANRPVAAKEMVLGDGIAEKKAIDDFKREASVLATVSHPSIPQVIDFFTEGGRHYLVMEYVAGGDLQHRLDALGPRARIPEAQVTGWAREILEVLYFLHSQKPPLVYRDLKPGNIMIDQRGHAMLIDFGIARFLPPGGHGTQIGSVGYAPPEQYLGKMEPRSDLYGLAATMHHLLTGRDPQLEPPFSFPPVRELAPEVSEATAAVVMRALDQNIEKRPRSAQEMRDLLPATAAGKPASASIGVADGNGRGGAQMATIVLDRPQAAARAATPRSLVMPAAKPKTARGDTQRSLNLPVKNMSVSNPPAGLTPARSGASATAKTRDLGLKAQAPQIVKPASANKPQSPRVVKAAAVSSRAKTPARLTPPDLRVGVPVPVPARAALGSTIVATVEAGAAPTRIGNGGSRNAIELEPGSVAAGAWLATSGDAIRFSLTGSRVVIGRNVSGLAGSASNGRRGADYDDVDVDLSRLPRGGDRVSHRHAEIIRQGADYFIRDLGSLNGTYVAGRGRLGRDQLYKLRDRDEIVLGGAKLEFRKS